MNVLTDAPLCYQETTHHIVTAFIMNLEVFWPKFLAGIVPDTFRKITANKNIETERAVTSNG